MPWGSCPCPGVEMRGSPPLAPPLCVCGEIHLTLPYLSLRLRLLPAVERYDLAAKSWEAAAPSQDEAEESDATEEEATRERERREWDDRESGKVR